MLDLGKAERTEPSKQATDYTRPSRPGPFLQRTLSPRSHSDSLSVLGGQPGKRTEPGARAWGLASIPLPQQAHDHPTGGQKPSDLPDESAPRPGAPTGPAWRPTTRLLFPGPIVSDSLACPHGAKGGFPEGFLNGLADKHPVSGWLTAWPGEATGGWGQRCSGNGRDWGRLRGPTQDPVREEVVRSQKLTSVESILPGSAAARHGTSQTLVCFSQPA